ncbi:hypothetical protein ACLI1A_01715 [Flavobacterium sp. RHBU_3]|uniref:hypothetical protein n=1 Tax=Flavobacterium sp. RHBU_3 TaxID=3391184 RepID=UPI003984635F
MKKLLFLFTAIFMFVSCKKEAEQQVLYPTMKVAVKEKGEFKVLNDSLLRQEWEKELVNVQGKIQGFEVEQLTVKDTDAVATVITAYCKDGKTTVGALLKERDGYYYFNLNEAMVVCTGCIEGCKPQAVSVGRQFKLVCSTCNDCVKTEFSPNIP